MTIQSFRASTGLALLGAVALTTLTAEAVSATEPERRTATVSYADLDLSRPEGRATLDARLAQAARSVCRQDDWRDLRSLSGSTSCRALALQSADRARDEAVIAQRQKTNEMVAARAPLP